MTEGNEDETGFHEHEGWIALPEMYDDGGISGVNGGVKTYRRGGAKVSHGLGGSLSR